MFQDKKKKGYKLGDEYLDRSLGFCITYLPIYVFPTYMGSEVNKILRIRQSFQMSRDHLCSGGPPHYWRTNLHCVIGDGNHNTVCLKLLKADFLPWQYTSF